MDDGGQRVLISSYKINKSCRCNVEREKERTLRLVI